MNFGMPNNNSPFTDKAGIIRRDWYLFLNNLLNSVYTSSDGSAGVSGTFTTADAKTVTVKDGIITNIV